VAAALGFAQISFLSHGQRENGSDGHRGCSSGL
jgi:hypothetical protein